jgi:hypothetical protein
VAEFGVSRGHAARARAGLKQAWRAGSGIVKPNCDGFGSGGGACIVDAAGRGNGHAEALHLGTRVCRVSCVVCAGLHRQSLSGGRPVSRERAHAIRTRRRCFAGRRRGEQADGRLSLLCSTVLLLLLLLLLGAVARSCLAARLSLCPLSLHSDIPLSICLPLLLVPAASTAHPLARPRPSSQHPAPPALFRNGRLTPVVRNARWLRPKIAPPSQSSQFPPAPPVRSTRPLLISSAGLPHVQRQSA